MGTHTATIETLTAEVRVLMVGSRQVTLSVARQLDRVQLQDMDPFGRVMINRDDDRYCLIGKQKETGVLVLSSGPMRFQPSLPRPDERIAHDTFRWKAWDQWDREAKLREYVDSLPLIVLAGLK